MRVTLQILVATVTLATAGCINARPPTDTGDPVTPAAPSSPGAPSSPATPQALAYDPDLKALFASDCVTCHGGFRVDGNYRMTTYQDVMKDVQPGSASSKLVTITQPRGSMSRYFSGSTSSQQSKASAVLQWVVTYKAQQTR
jgi:mono/diheme cytochrome c family protein